MAEDKLVKISEATVAPLLHRTVKAPSRDAAADQQARDPNALSDDEFRCFKRIYQVPEIIEMRCASLGWDRDRDYSARDKLERRGLIQCLGTVANKRKVYGPTPTKGDAFARKKGWGRPKYKSQELHEAVVLSLMVGIASSIGKLARVVRAGYADILDGIQADVAVRFQSGMLAVFQVCDRNRAVKECEVLLRLCGLDVVDEVVSVPANTGTKAKLEKELTRQAGRVRNPKLILLDAEQVILPGSDWTWLLERPV